jgi:hypothetical protein
MSTSRTPAQCEACQAMPATREWFYAEPDVVCPRWLLVCDLCWKGLAETARWIGHPTVH